MKINRIKWRGYKGLPDGEILANGNDVIISGRNGAGKSSIAQILPFVLFGKLVGTLKRYDENGLTQRDGLWHGAEVEFDGGLRLSRMLVDSNSGGLTTKFYVNGASVQKRRFDSTVDAFTNGAGELALNPFAFFDMTTKDKRNFISRTFGATGDREFLSMPEFAEIAQMFGDMSADVFIARCKSELKEKQSLARDISPRIEELQRQLADLPKDVNSNTIDTQLTAKRTELANLMTTTPQPQLPTQRINELERQESYICRQLERERQRRESLLADWHRVKSSKAGTCPTCGQKIPADLFAAKRDEKLCEITAEGKLAAAQISEFETELKTTQAELDTLRKQAADLQSQMQQSANLEAERAELVKKIQADINTLEAQKNRVESAKKIQKRIASLETQERALNVAIANLEGNLARAEKFQHEKITRFEEQINANFEHVRFKLFDKLIDDTPRETCDAMIDGVPYAALSKGEKLKAALDIWRALQKHYGVDLPLIIDEAEAYTANSLVDVPNQKIILRVAESDLLIETSDTLPAEAYKTAG